jgi:hypothetical protein
LIAPDAPKGAITRANQAKSLIFLQNQEAVERVKGIEPSYAAWEAAVLPLNYTREVAERAFY